MTPPGKMRLNRFIARCGIASRREADKLIESGRVAVNGTPCTELGSSVEPGVDIVEVDGKVIELPALLYFKYYKPPGVTTTIDDPHAERTIGDVLKENDIPDGVVPAGRLDRESEGLLILTNDGDLLNALTHPSHGVTKLYRVLIDRWPREHDLQKLRDGIQCKEYFARALRVTRMGPQPSDDENPRPGYWIGIVMGEGKKREIREMMDALGFKVFRLVRIGHGSLTSYPLKPGEIRELDEYEKKALLGCAGLR